MKILLSAVAEENLAEIGDWYGQFGLQLSTEFLDDFEDSCAVIKQFPNTGIIFRKKYRLFVMNGFPYLITYEVIKETILILSVVHNSRSLKNRLKGTGK